MEVVDSRSVADFQKFTFSGHLRTGVLKVIDENIRLGNADYTCYWALEMLCSGLVHSLWTQFFESSAKHIHRACPAIFPYLVRKYEDFSVFEHQYPVLQMTAIRNNVAVRDIICEVAATLALCRKHKAILLPKIRPEHDFIPATIQEMLKAPSSTFGRAVSLGEDPIELYVPLNEFVYCLKPESRDVMRALYWCAWMLKYTSQKKKEKQEIVCGFRGNEYIDDVGARHPIWMIWDAVHKASIPIHRAHIDALFKMYCLRWKPALLKQKMPFLLSAIEFVCEGGALDIHARVPTEYSLLLANIPQWIQAIVDTKKTFTS